MVVAKMITIPKIAAGMVATVLYSMTSIPIAMCPTHTRSGMVPAMEKNTCHKSVARMEATAAIVRWVIPTKLAMGLAMEGTTTHGSASGMVETVL